jgi:hypothetical protein
VFRHGVRSVPDIGESAAVRPDAGTEAAGRSKLAFIERIPRENLLFSWHVGNALRVDRGPVKESIGSGNATSTDTVDGRTG